MIHNRTEAGEGAEGAEFIGALVSLAITAGMFYGAYYIGKTKGREEEQNRDQRRDVDRSRKEQR